MNQAVPICSIPEGVLWLTHEQVMSPDLNMTEYKGTVPINKEKDICLEVVT